MKFLLKNGIEHGDQNQKHAVGHILVFGIDIVSSMMFSCVRCCFLQMLFKRDPQTPRKQNRFIQFALMKAQAKALACLRKTCMASS